jgi:hypothetical protein
LLSSNSFFGKVRGERRKLNRKVESKERKLSELHQEGDNFSHDYH